MVNLYLSEKMSSSVVPIEVCFSELSYVTDIVLDISGNNSPDAFIISSFDSLIFSNPIFIFKLFSTVLLIVSLIVKP